MSFSQPFRRGLIACVLLSAAVGSAALTLGRSRGVALVGRTLDISIPVTLDDAAQAADLCPEADVFHGDTRVPAGRVAARVEPGSGLAASVRIQSSAPIDEPVVTVYLRLGCKERFTRRYVLLTEEPGEVPVAQGFPAAAAPLPGPGSAARTSAQSASRALVPAAGTDAAPAAVAPAARAPSARSAERARRSAEAPVTPRGGAVPKLEAALPSMQQRAAPAAKPATRPVTRGRSRLTVDILDLTSERDPQLRSTAGLTGTPSTDEQVRAQAAALWRSINAQPEDVLRDLQRVQALENDVKGLRGQIAGNDKTLAELRGQIAQAQQERTLTLAAIALLSLLLAAVIVTWWLRRRDGSGSDWWRRGGVAAGAAEEGGGLGPVGDAPGSPPLRAADMDLRVDESMFESLKKPPRVPVMPSAAALARTQALKPSPPPVPTEAPAAPAFALPDRHSGPSSFHSSFQSSSMASMRMVKAEELVDIQQQADFFLSLGQTEQAIEVLESHIQTSAETSALVWLDLLAIYRSLKRRNDYELLRGDFQRVFNADVPAYDATPTVSGGLEDYPRALSRIEALWPSPKVMDVIEESIFRKPGMEGAEPFDLEAYRELVLLYNLGREVVTPESGAPDTESGSQSTFNQTSMQPLSVRRGSAAPEQDSTPGLTNLGDMVDLDSLHQMLDSEVDTELGERSTGGELRDPTMPRPSPRLGLDIDLTAPAEPARKPRAASGNSIDFELSEPHSDSGAGKDKAD